MGTGSGTMTPVGGGVPGAATTAVPLPYTFLSIYRYAKFLGVAPVHFAGASCPDISPQVFPSSGCSTIWRKYDWQSSDQVSHMQLAYAISEAETEISRALGFFPAPEWVVEEDTMYPRPYRRYYSAYGLDVSNRLKAVHSVRSGKIINGGRRAVSLVGTATTVGGSLSYTDEDSDGFSETATITLATALTDVQEIKLYHTGMNGDREWEIRPIRSKSISGGNVTIIADSWLFIDPELYEAYPIEGGLPAINISTTNNYVTSVDVYREYNDTTQSGSQFIWENDITKCSCGGVGCEDCEPVTQNGCLTIRNATSGAVTPIPASYSAADGEWSAAEWTESREPDRVKLWYYAGEVDQMYLQNRSYDPLSHSYAQAIFWLASARLDRPLCGCDGVESVIDELRMDMAHATREKGTHFLTPDAMASPFGTRKGEVMAWRRINKLATKRLGVAVI